MARINTLKGALRSPTSQKALNSILIEYDCTSAVNYLKTEGIAAGLKLVRQMNPDMIFVPRGAVSTSDFMARSRTGRLPFTYSVTTCNKQTHRNWAMHVVKWSDGSILIVQWSEPKDGRPLANGYVGKRVVVTWDGHPEALRRIRTRGLNVISRPLRNVILRQDVAVELSKSGYPVKTMKNAFTPFMICLIPNLNPAREVELYDPFAGGFLFQKEKDTPTVWVNNLSQLAREL